MGSYEQTIIQRAAEVTSEALEGGVTDRRLLRLGAGDNVLIVTAPIGAGEQLLIDGVVCGPRQAVATGFKLAARDLAPGEVAVRLGFPIGEITAPVARGELVHVHNLKSRYLRTHDRGEA